MARIVMVYRGALLQPDRERGELVPREMGYIRWLRMSEELARLGHQVDVAVADEIVGGRHRAVGHLAPVPRRVPLSTLRWSDYDVVKTEYHKGFDTLERFGGAEHPFVIAHLGSTVAPEDRAGIYFYGETREQLFATQERVNRLARFVALLTPPAAELWRECFGPRERLLVVPGAADRDVPPPGRDPFPSDQQRRVLFAGNVYDQTSQPEAHAEMIDRLNRLGKLLRRSSARLYMIGTGDVSELDPDAVTFVGALPYQDTWDYLHFADVGVVVSMGPYLHNNESTKIYTYLRLGLPVVSEAGFPNDDVVRESGLGYVVENGAPELMAEAILQAAGREWDRDRAVRYILDNHTWDRRAEVYDRILRGLGDNGQTVEA